MQRDDFPYKPRNDDVGMARIHPSKISHYLELSQLGRDVDGKLFLHTDPVTRGNATTNDEVRASLLLRNGCCVDFKRFPSAG